MAAANQGDVEIILGDDTATLRCTLRAAKEVNAYFGNFLEAFRRLGAFDLEAYPVIVAAGMGKNVKDVEDRVFQSGITDLCEPLSEFVGFLTRGGQPFKDEPPVNGKDASGNV